MDFPDFLTKQAARDWALQQRAAIPPTERRIIGERAIQHLLRTPGFDRAEALLTYVGSKDSELDTLPLIEAALALGKTVLVPITRARGVMVWSRLEDITVLRMTPLGLLEPQADAVRLVAPDGGLCIVPGLGFRGDGHRVGFGGGYYDRFLSSFRGDTAALVPETLFGMSFPIEPHDQAVDAVVTELGVHRAER